MEGRGHPRPNASDQAGEGLPLAEPSRKSADKEAQEVCYVQELASQGIEQSTNKPGRKRSKRRKVFFKVRKLVSPTPLPRKNPKSIALAGEKAVLWTLRDLAPSEVGGGSAGTEVRLDKGPV